MSLHFLFDTYGWPVTLGEILANAMTFLVVFLLCLQGARRAPDGGHVLRAVSSFVSGSGMAAMVKISSLFLLLWLGYADEVDSLL